MIPDLCFILELAQWTAVEPTRSKQLSASTVFLAVLPQHGLSTLAGGVSQSRVLLPWRKQAVCRERSAGSALRRGHSH